MNAPPPVAIEVRFVPVLDQETVQRFEAAAAAGAAKMVAAMVEALGALADRVADPSPAPPVDTPIDLFVGPEGARSPLDAAALAAKIGVPRDDLDEWVKFTALGFGMRSRFTPAPVPITDEVISAQGVAP